MARKTKIAYWLLPAAALCVAASLAVTPSYARYENSSVWHTVVSPEKRAVTSPFLGESNRPLIVMTGQMEGQTKEIIVPLQSNFDTAGVLSWQVDKPDYVEISVQAGGAQLTAGEELTLLANTPTPLTVTLTATEKAAQPHEKITVAVQLSFGGELSGTFWVELNAVEETLPDEGENAGQVEQQAEEIADNTSDVEDEAVSEKSEILSPEGSGEETPPQDTPSEGTPPADTPSEDIPPGVTLTAPAVWYPQTPIDLTVSVRESAVISLQRLEADVLQPMPAATRFSLDGGTIWFALYTPDALQLSLLVGQTQKVLLDISHTELKDKTEITFATDADTRVTVAGYTGALYEASGNMLTTGGAITLTLPTVFENAQLTWSAEMLTAADGENTYVPVDLNQGALQAALTATEQGQQLTLSIAEKIPPAGTYRLHLRWQEGEREMMDVYEYFFIHYNENAGGERQ